MTPKRPPPRTIQEANLQVLGGRAGWWVSTPPSIPKTHQAHHSALHTPMLPPPARSPPTRPSEHTVNRGPLHAGAERPLLYPTPEGLCQPFQDRTNLSLFFCSRGVSLPNTTRTHTIKAAELVLAPDSNVTGNLSQMVQNPGIILAESKSHRWAPFLVSSLLIQTSAIDSKCF